MEIDLQHLVPRIYLDSCVLADALLDRGSIATTAELLKEIPIARRILSNWPKENMYISPFVLGEILELGDKYGKNLEEMQELIKTRILPRCTVTFTDMKEFSSFSTTYRAIGLEAFIALNTVHRGDLTDNEGRIYTNMEKDRHVFADGSEARGISGGIPLGGELPDPSAELESPTMLSMSAPLLEIGIFHRAAQIVHESGSPWKDAFHFHYSKKESCSYIVTNDVGLLEMDRLPKDWPIPVKPTGLRDQMSKWLSTELYKAIFDE